MGFCTKLKCLICDQTITDNVVFRLHYKLTVIVLVVASVLVACSQSFGGAVDCIVTDSTLQTAINKFCWIHATYSVPSAWEKAVGQEVPYPGVDKYHRDKRIYHGYYRWVSFVLFLQAIFFYTPRIFWKTMEGGKIRNLISRTNISASSEDMKCIWKKQIVQYLVTSTNNNSLYFISCFVSEIMNFVNVVCQIFFTDLFLGGEFLSYGIKVIQFTGWDSSISYNPMIKVFPRETMCTFYRYASSGDIERHDVACILSTNSVNDKIYIFLWLWFIVLSVLSGLVLIYRTAIIFSPVSRIMAIRLRTQLAKHDLLRLIIHSCSLGDWLVLDLLSKNLDPPSFSDIINGFGQNLMNMNDDNFNEDVL